MSRFNKLKNINGLKKMKKIMPLNAELRQRLIRIEHKLNEYDDQPKKEVSFIQSIEEDDVIRLIKYDKHTKKNADLALKDIIVPFPNFDSADFSESYDWQIDRSEKYGHSYQLYIQALRIVSSLLLEYEESENMEYLRKARFIIESWMDFKDTEPENRMIWYDHPAANRAQNIIHFLFLSKNKLKIDEERYYDTLLEHAEFMSDPSEYRPNNHGLMMDRALMILGRILDRKDMFNIGYYRAIDTFWFSFSAKAVHLENSPEYHTMVRNMYLRMEEYLNNHNLSFGENVKGYLEKSKDYLDILSRPDRRLPALGDSGNSIGTQSKKYKNFVDYEAGISVLQYSQPKPLYLSFISGFSTNTHKHRDDLSITLQYDREDILVDPGKFNYSRNPIRTYMQSPKAHSTLFFERDKYTKDHNNRFTRLIETTNFFENDKYVLVTGVNNGFKNSYMDRTVIMLKEHPIVLLLDRTDSEEKVYQNFNLDQNAKVEVYDEDLSIVQLSSGKKIGFYQMNKVEGIEEIKPSLNKPVASVNTIGFGKAIKTEQMRFVNASPGRSAYTFETMICMDDSLTVSDYKNEDSYLTFKVNGKDININI